jgi:hypothetical protein
MLERIDISDLIALCDSPEVKRAMADLPREDWLRGLARCLWLKDGADIAIFQPMWLNQFAAIIFDIDTDTQFVWEVFDFMFTKIEAETLKLASREHEAGIRYRCRWMGQSFIGDRSHTWALDRAEWLQAAADRPRVAA